MRSVRLNGGTNYRLKHPRPVPALPRHARPHKPQMSRSGASDTSPMPPRVAVKACRHNVARTIAAALTSRHEMLSGAPQRLGLTIGNAKTLHEGSRIALPHRQPTVIAAATLPLESLRSETRN